MSRKFATVSGVRVALVLILMTILSGALDVQAQQVPAQQPPAQPPAEQQQPAAQPAEPQQPAGQSSSQQASPEEIGSARKPKVKEYKNLTFNVGGGGSLTNGQTTQFVRGWCCSQLQQVFRAALRLSVGQFASAHLGSATGAGAQRDRPCLFFPIRSHNQHSGHESVERLHCGRRRLFSSIRKAVVLDCHSGFGLQPVFHLVGQLLRRQPPPE